MSLLQYVNLDTFFSLYRDALQGVRAREGMYVYIGY
jgi:hypothetical protein